MNFTPAYVHQVNNKTLLVQERRVLKQADRERRRAYWCQETQALQGGEPKRGLDINGEEIVECRANMQDTLRRGQGQNVTIHQEGDDAPYNDSPHTLILSH